MRLAIIFELDMPDEVTLRELAVTLYPATLDFKRQLATVGRARLARVKANPTGAFRRVLVLDPQDLTEADEAATSKEVALANLRDQIAKDETHGVIAMYERAAWGAGASVKETEAILCGAKP